MVVWYGSTVRRMNKFGYCSRGDGSRYFFFPLVLGVVVGCWCGGFLFFSLLLGTLFEKDVPWCFVSSCSGAPLSFPSHCLSSPQIQRGFLFGPCRSLSLTPPPDPRRFSGDGQSLHDVNILPFSSLLFFGPSLFIGVPLKVEPRKPSPPPVHLYVLQCCTRGILSGPTENTYSTPIHLLVAQLLRNIGRYVSDIVSDMIT